MLFLQQAMYEANIVPAQLELANQAHPSQHDPPHYRHHARMSQPVGHQSHQLVRLPTRVFTYVDQGPNMNSPHSPRHMDDPRNYYSFSSLTPQSCDPRHHTTGPPGLTRLSPQHHINNHRTWDPAWGSNSQFMHKPQAHANPYSYHPHLTPHHNQPRPLPSHHLNHPLVWNPSPSEIENHHNH